MLAATWFLCPEDTYITSPVNLAFTGFHKLKVIQCMSCCTRTKQLATTFLFHYLLCLVVKCLRSVSNFQSWLLCGSEQIFASYNLECKTTTCRIAITIYWIASYNWMKKVLMVACLNTIWSIQGMPFSLHTQNWLWKYWSMNFIRFVLAGTTLDCS